MESRERNETTYNEMSPGKEIDGEPDTATPASFEIGGPKCV